VGLPLGEGDICLLVGRAILAKSEEGGEEGREENPISKFLW